MSAPSLMFREAAEAGSVCARQLAANAAAVADAAGRLRALDPPFTATLARGSSDQAAAFAKVLFETRLRLPTLSHSPSIGTLYGATSPKFAGVPLLAISQSGKSPDLLGAATGAKEAGATVLGLVNDATSPLAAAADLLLPLHAGAERSVAATKSFVASLVAVAALTAAWSRDEILAEALMGVEEALQAAWLQDWGAALAPLRDAESLLVLGRGLTLPIAGEAALKLKETSALHAEAFSSAEVAHGPMTLVGARDPVLVFAPADAAAVGLQERLEAFASRGAQVIIAGQTEATVPGAIMLPLPPGLHPVMEAIAAILSFYRFAEQLSRARGRDPDLPPYLSKVTQTR